MTKYVILALFIREITTDTGHENQLIAKPISNKKYTSRSVAERYVPREAPTGSGFIGFRIDEIFLTAKDEVKLKYPEAEIVINPGVIKRYRVYDKASSSNLSFWQYTELDAWESVIRIHIK